MSLLEDARKQINEVDEQMAELFEKRMQAVEDVIHYKQENNLAVLDTSREQEILDKNIHYIHKEEYKELYKDFMKNVMAQSRRYQKMVISKDVVGYQGTQGAFSYITCTHVFPDMKKQRYATFEDVVNAVSSGEITYGVIPFENSYTGEIGEVLDILIQYENVYIHDIYDLKISQNLLGVKGARIEDVRQVYSKDQAIYQSKKFLEGRNMELIPYANTALAAEYVAKQNDKTKAAIAAKENAELYGLDILAEDINTSAQNTTRFIIIKRELEPHGNEFSILFKTQHKAGALLEVMQIISNYGFNMESIKSRSMKDSPWEYYFYVEIVGNLQHEAEQKLLEDLKKACAYVRVLGAYQKESRDEK
ncbi:chorismate mutase [Amedibacillus sp. YH-ame10]